MSSGTSTSHSYSPSNNDNNNRARHNHIHQKAEAISVAADPRSELNMGFSEENIFKQNQQIMSSSTLSSTNALPVHPPLTADQFSSSLASIAGEQRQQQQQQQDALQHQQSSSSTDESFTSNHRHQHHQYHHHHHHAASVDNNKRPLAAAAMVTTGSSSNNGSSNSGSGGDSGNDDKLQQQSPLHHPYHHNHSHHHHDQHLKTPLPSSSTNPVAASSSTSSAATIPFHNNINHNSNANLRLNPTMTATHATVVARMPPPERSSTSNEGSISSGHRYHHRHSGGVATTSVFRGPAYHTIKQTCLQKSRSKNRKQEEAAKPGLDTPASSETFKNKTSSSKSSSLSFKQQQQMDNHKTCSSFTKKRSRPATADDDDAGYKLPAVKHPRRAISKTTTAAEDEDGSNSSSSSSGSGTEAGYAGSASSNDNKQPSASDSNDAGGDSGGGGSSSNDSSDIPDFPSSGASASTGATCGPSNSPSLSSSNGEMDDDDDEEENVNQFYVAAQILKNPANATVALHQPKRLVPGSSATAAVLLAKAQFAKVSRSAVASTMAVPLQDRKRAAKRFCPSEQLTTSRKTKTTVLSDINDGGNKPPIMALGSDLMAHVLTYLDPPDILQVLTMPLSKEWQMQFANQQDLWRVLCLLEPFKAHVQENDFSSSSSSSSSGGDSPNSSSDDDDDAADDGSLSSVSNSGSVNGRNRTISRGPLPPPPAAWKQNSRVKTAAALTSSSVAKVACKKYSASPSAYRRGVSMRRSSPTKTGKYRLLYTSFVRCMKYLDRMKEDVLHGRPPSVIDYGGSSVVAPRTMQSNRSLQQFLAGARDVVREQEMQVQQQRQEVEGGPGAVPAAAVAASMPILSADDGSNSYQSSTDGGRKRKKNLTQSRQKRPKFGRSMLTDRLLAPAANGQVNPDNISLPWSCALYSIVNWMVAFADVEGIQIMCLKVLPMLLEDEQQRITAQRVGLTDVILRGMVLFPNSVHLHTASFHTLVLLARPLGGREGMLFHSSMVNAAGIFSGNGAAARDAALGVPAGRRSEFSGGVQNDGKSGIAVMLDSMRRFEDDEALQAMSCWSLVNIALAPAQKEVLVKLGGIEVTTNAMMRHPHSAEVQFRALFALINLVIPSVNVAEESNVDQRNGADNGGIFQELDDMVGQITNLVVLGMKNFCSSEAILNRACLVLHNLSLTKGYHTTLLWTPNCYQMLEWCLANYRTDQVLQQSAAGTLHRLQVTLSNDENLRARFAASIQAQQQLSLQAAHREALEIYEQQEQ